MRSTGQDARPATVGDWIERGAARFRRAGLAFGHDSADAIDEAAALVWHVLELPHDTDAQIYGRPVAPADGVRIEALFRRRIEERMPAAYLTGRTWFAGLELLADPRALVPRSPIAELLEDAFSPWLDPHAIESVLDLCTGGGCIAIAAALACPQARVDAVDVSAEALALASENVHRHNLERRVRLSRGDLFEPVAGRCYDVIISNPPYVAEAQLRTLPREYGHEPVVGFAGGADGLDVVRRILDGAAAHLRPGGALIVEVGDQGGALEAQYPHLPFVWLDFARGDADVLLLLAEDLMTRRGSPDVR